MPLGPRFRLAACLAALLLGASACGSDEPEGPLTGGESDPSASATATPSTEAPSKPEVPQVKDTRVGREKVARWFMGALEYAYATNDASPITDLASTRKGARCVNCPQFADYLAEQDEKGRHLEGVRYQVKDVFETAQPLPGVFVLEVTSDHSARKQVDADGEVLDRQPAQKNVVTQVGVTFIDDAPRITGWATKETQS